MFVHGQLRICVEVESDVGLMPFVERQESITATSHVRAASLRPPTSASKPKRYKLQERVP